MLFASAADVHSNVCLWIPCIMLQYMTVHASEGGVTVSAPLDGTNAIDFKQHS